MVTEAERRIYQQLLAEHEAEGKPLPALSDLEGLVLSDTRTGRLRLTPKGKKKLQLASAVSGFPAEAVRNTDDALFLLQLKTLIKALDVSDEASKDRSV